MRTLAEAEQRALRRQGQRMQASSGHTHHPLLRQCRHPLRLRLVRRVAVAQLTITTKAEAEQMLLGHLMDHIKQLSPDQKVLLKLTIPNGNNLFAPCINHPNVIRVFALSGGYSREDANSLLTQNKRMVASFNRALTEGLSVEQSDEEFNLILDSSIESIYQASIT